MEFLIKEVNDTIYMMLIDERKLHIKKEVRITAMVADLPYIDVKNHKMRIDVERKLVALMHEREDLVWLRYFKFKDEETFKQFLRKVIRI